MDRPAAPGPRPEVCVGAVVVDQERLLMVQRCNPPGSGRWSLPGGRVEAGELMAAAVVREVHEETGLRVAPGELVGWVEAIGPEYHFVIFDFLATVEAPDDMLPAPGDDAAAVAWVPLDEVDDLDLVDGLRDFLHHHRLLD